MSSDEDPSRRVRLVGLLVTGLVLTHAGQSLITKMSYSAAGEAGHIPYNQNSAVMFTELFKLGIALVSLASTGDCEHIGLGERNPLSTLLKSKAYAMPALLYFIHNSMVYTALSYLSAPAYQLLNNMKIITTGAVFRVVLGKKLRVIQWVAVLQLMMAMVCTPLQLQGAANATSSASTSSSSDFLKGVLAVVVIALTSSGAGVYSELLLKRSGLPVHAANFWLYLYGSISSGVGYLWARDPDKGMLDGYNAFTWGTIVSNGLLGLIISFIFKYGDNIIKLFGAAASVLASSVVSILLFDDFHPNTGLWISCLLVATSSFLYYGESEALFRIDSEALCGTEKKPEPKPEVDAELVGLARPQDTEDNDKS